jgi:thioredoxin-related protein
MLGLALAPAPALAADDRGELKDLGEFSIPGWFKVSFLDLPADARAAAAQGKHLLLVWYQDGCPYCARLIDTNFSQKRINDYTREHFDAVALNLWGSRQVTSPSGQTMTEKQLGKELGVQFTPTLQFLDGSGEVVLRLDGYYPPERFLAALRYVGEGRAGEVAFDRYLERHATERDGDGKLADADYLAQPPHDLASVDRPVAVLFEQTACPACDRLHRGILSEDRARELLAEFHVVQLDRWSQTEVVTPAGETTTAEAWGDALGLRYVPAMVLFDDGREIIRMESLLKGFHVRSLLAYVASDAYEDQPRFQPYIQERSKRLRDKGVTVDLWEED